MTYKTHHLGLLLRAILHFYTTIWYVPQISVRTKAITNVMRYADDTHRYSTVKTRGIVGCLYSSVWSEQIWNIFKGICLKYTNLYS
jgi:hypothetical protein